MGIRVTQVQLVTTKSFNWLDFRIKSLFLSCMYYVILLILMAIVNYPESSEE